MKYLKFIALAILIILVGYYFGIRSQTVNVVVNEVSPTGNPEGTKTVQLKGSQLSHGMLTDLFGNSIITQGENLPWYISRTSAIMAYVLMFLVLEWGTGMTTGAIYKFIQPTAAWAIHKSISIVMSTLVFIHIISLLFDRFINFGLLEILVPFASNYKPVFVSLGIIGFYILLIIMLTSIFYRAKSERLWHLIHFAVYPLFILILFHGLYSGTDSKALAMILVYRVTGIIFAATLIYRFTLYYFKPKI